MLRNKFVFSFKNRSRTGKTDNFSSPDYECTPIDIPLQQLHSACQFTYANEYRFHWSVWRVIFLCQAAKQLEQKMACCYQDKGENLRHDHLCFKRK